jgi:hypothetical protein
MLADSDQKPDHAAPGSAIGFFYQSYYSLLALIEQKSDVAAIGVELLDDLQLTDGPTEVMFQLKHSIAANPTKISIKSVMLWKTLAAWIDILGKINLSETSLNLVTVAGIDCNSPLLVLTSNVGSRSKLITELDNEAQRVATERQVAKNNNEKLPHADRTAGCTAWQALSVTLKKLLISRVTLKMGSPAIGNIEEKIANALSILPKKHREGVANKLLQWWDMQVVYSLCGKRKRVIEMTEVQSMILNLSSECASEELKAEFETIKPPDSYQPHGMIVRQIQIVNGLNTHIRIATRDEWRARSERAKWINDRPDMAVTIDEYDTKLIETWEDHHGILVDNCPAQDNSEKCVNGLALLSWVHDHASKTIDPIKDGYRSSYYVRGSFHILAATLKVGWHPEYLTLLGGVK